MAEIKRTFTAGRMNKDLDERLVPPGEYRDALNIQVKTTDGSSTGSVQRIQNNVEIGSSFLTTTVAGLKTKAVGSVADERNNKGYFLFASPNYSYSEFSKSAKTFWVDSVLMQDAEGTTVEVFKDLWAITGRYVDFDSNTTNHAIGTNKFLINVDTSVGKAPTVGMTFRVYNSSNVQLGSDSKVTGVVSGGSGYVILDKTFNFNFSSVAYVVFIAEDRVLGLDYDKRINAINIIDDLLLYTNGEDEPIKINTKRSIVGTIQSNTDPSRTALTFLDNNGVVVPAPTTSYNNGSVSKRDITVIKKAPKVAPLLVLSNTKRTGGISFAIEGYNVIGQARYAEDYIVINQDATNLDLNVGDILTMTCENDNEDPISQIRLSIEGIGLRGISATIISQPSDLLATHTSWFIQLEQKDNPMFELKFPKFCFRYKYTDGEYSTYGPWSRAAFLPGEFEYNPKEGNNLGMANTVRQITIKNLLQSCDKLSEEINCIDILYKSTESPSVYLARSVKKGVDPEWSVDSTTSSNDVIITSDMIYSILPANQALRVWDNVPTKALSQEIIGNRLIYGNYCQGYDDTYNLSLSKELVSKSTSLLTAKQSVKSLRSYRLGVVFGDKFGRETPVISPGTRALSNATGVIKYNEDTLFVPKSQGKKSNSISVAQVWGDGDNINQAPEGWVDYFKYYIKSSSNDYYNLAMDRWYDARDGNVWISFPSSERNKVDEDSYLILKNVHGEPEAVDEDAKYKVLDISNEAPDYIKTLVLKMGESNVDPDDTVYNSENSPNFLMTSINFILNNFDLDISKDNISVRIKASFTDSEGQLQVKSTNYKRVSQFIKQTNSANGSIKISSAFGEDADFTTLFTNAGLFSTKADAEAALEYNFDFKKEVVENSPEYDGRFFVKLNKDSIIEENVLTDFNNNFSYDIINSFRIGYINTVDFTNPASTGLYNTYTFNGFERFTTSTKLGKFADSSESPEGTTDTDIFWEEYLTQMQLTSSQSHSAFIDKSSFTSVITDGTWETSANRGFAKSGAHNIGSTFDRIFFGNVGSQGSVRHVKDFKNLMTTPGNIFRFRNDPNESVYKIIRGQGQAKVRNVSGLNSNDVDGNRERNVYFTTFRKINVATNKILDQGINFSDYDPRGDFQHDGSTFQVIDVLERSYDIERANTPSNSAVFETEPKEIAEADLYYEASNAIPARLNKDNTALFAPVGSGVDVSRNDITSRNPFSAIANNSPTVAAVYDGIVKVTNSTDGSLNTEALVNDIMVFTHPDGTVTRSRIKGFVNVTDIDDGSNKLVPTPKVSILGGITAIGGANKRIVMDIGTNNTNGIVAGQVVSGSGVAGTPTVSATGFVGTNNWFDLSVGQTGTNTNISFVVGSGNATGYYLLDKNVYKYKVEIPWFNCYTFGNGVESNRIRDDFNAPHLGTGEKASTTLPGYGEEKLTNSLIYSSIYNSSSSVNGLNEFNASERITKDINPEYGTIQALKTRDSNVVVFTEDKVLKVLANKDILFNADGTTNVTASDKVLGNATPFSGDYGISTDPSSIASDQYRIYFTDKQRGAVLRLSMDGLTPISNVGMKSFFRDHLPKSKTLVGTFDKVSGEYNLGIEYQPIWDSETEYSTTTVSFNESSKGWVSFKSFTPPAGLSVAGKYFTTDSNGIYLHNSGNFENSFYGVKKDSSITVLFNDSPSEIKNFETIVMEAEVAQLESLADQANFTDAAGNTLSDFNDGSYHALSAGSTDANETRRGWFCEDIITNAEEGVSATHQVNIKEGKAFSHIRGKDIKSTDRTIIDDTSKIDFSNLSVQGLGEPVSITYSDSATQTFTIIIQ